MTGNRSPDATAIRAVVKVGDGRGFVIEGERERYIITAAHCLPHLPPAHAASYAEERHYFGLVGPLGGDASIAVQCLFVDPVSDLAVLGEPDGQELFEEAEAYEALVDAATVLPVGGIADEAEAWLLGLDGRWFRCNVWRNGVALWLKDAAQSVEGGMSGSPILANGKAIGVVATAGGTADSSIYTEGGPEPALAQCLPVWLAGVIARA
jgi:hypothetical protein